MTTIRLWVGTAALALGAAAVPGGLDVLPSGVAGLSRTSATQQPATAQPPEDALKGSAGNGKKIYVKYGCYQCHGREAQGGAAGPRLGPDSIGAVQFVRAVRQPNQMPPYTEKVLSEREIADIYAFVRSLPPAPRNLPIPE